MIKTLFFLEDFGSSYSAASCLLQPVDDSARWDTTTAASPESSTTCRGRRVRS